MGPTSGHGRDNHRRRTYRIQPLQDNPDQLKSARSGEADSHLVRLARDRT